MKNDGVYLNLFQMLVCIFVNLTNYLCIISITQQIVGSFAYFLYYVVSRNVIDYLFMEFDNYLG
jgi:hypothetical protein